MPTECNPNLFGFARVEGRSVVACFDGGTITTEAGGLLLGATDRAIRLVDRFAACFVDSRAAALVEHEVRTLVGQRVFGAVEESVDGAPFGELELKGFGRPIATFEITGLRRAG